MPQAPPPPPGPSYAPFDGIWGGGMYYLKQSVLQELSGKKRTWSGLGNTPVRALRKINNENGGRGERRGGIGRGEGKYWIHQWGDTRVQRTDERTAWKERRLSLFHRAAHSILLSPQLCLAELNFSRFVFIDFAQRFSGVFTKFTSCCSNSPLTIGFVMSVPYSAFRKLRNSRTASAIGLREFSYLKFWCISGSQVVMNDWGGSLLAFQTAEHTPLYIIHKDYCKLMGMKSKKVSFFEI